LPRRDARFFIYKNSVVDLKFACYYKFIDIYNQK